MVSSMQFIYFQAKLCAGCQVLCVLWGGVSWRKLQMRRQNFVNKMEHLVVAFLQICSIMTLIGKKWNSFTSNVFSLMECCMFFVDRWISSFVLDLVKSFLLSCTMCFEECIILYIINCISQFLSLSLLHLVLCPWIARFLPIMEKKLSPCNDHLLAHGTNLHVVVFLDPVNVASLYQFHQPWFDCIILGHAQRHQKVRTESSIYIQ